MAKLTRLAGSTGHVLGIFVQDTSKTDGSGLAGLTNASAGLTCYYKRNLDAASVAVTLTGTGTLGTFTSGLFLAVDATNMPGVYEFHPPNAAYASGAKSVVFMLKGAANMAPVLIEVELTAVDNQSAAFGLSLAKTTNITGFTDAPALTDYQQRSVAVTLPTNPPTDWLNAASVKADAVTKIQTGLALATQIPANFTTTAIATAVWQDTTAGDFTVANSPGAIVYSMRNMATDGQVLAVTSPTTFTVSVPVGYSDATLSSGVTLEFTSGANALYRLAIASAIRVPTTTTVGLTFAAPGFPVAPAIGDTIKIF